MRFVDDYLSYLLARASHLVAREFHAELKPHGLSVAEWRVLATLSDSDGLSLSALADAVLFKQPSLTKAIDRMERDGLVKRLPGTGDRRRIRIVITPRGAAAVRGRIDALGEPADDAEAAGAQVPGKLVGILLAAARGVAAADYRKGWQVQHAGVTQHI